MRTVPRTEDGDESGALGFDVDAMTCNRFFDAIRQTQNEVRVLRRLECATFIPSRAMVILRHASGDPGTSETCTCTTVAGKPQVRDETDSSSLK